MPETSSIPRIEGYCQNNQLEIAISGDWLSGAELPSIEPLLTQIATDKTIERLAFATQSLGSWDSLLITDLIKLIDCGAHRGVAVEKNTLPKAIGDLLALVYAVPERADARRNSHKLSRFAAVHAAAGEAMRHGKEILEFIGEMSLSMVSAFRGQSSFRSVDFWLYIQECGPSALPIVTLISLLVGLILAFVGAQQLSLFGAQIYIANLVSLGMTREMGGLMTAIIMSGRTGAAYAAQLGTMHVNNEIDALKTMNLEPMAFLVLPRMLALSLIMPLCASMPT